LVALATVEPAVVTVVAEDFASSMVENQRKPVENAAAADWSSLGSFPGSKRF
jgi:hypothetical protein